MSQTPWFDSPRSAHGSIGFSSWEAQLFFDNLQVTPLAP